MPGQHRLSRALAASPELLGAAAAGFSIGPMILLLAGAFTAPLAIALGAAGALAAVLVCGVPLERATRSTLFCTGAAALIAVGWFAYNVRYYAQDVYATRDPATYGLTARWLTEHASLNIAAHPEIFGSPAGASLDSAGFRTVAPGTVHAQGNHLLPALMSLAGRLFGTSALLQANVAIGALALFAFFGLARRVVGAPLAVLAMSTLAVSMPFVYVSRDAYSEPLMLLFLMGGLALLHRAVTSGRIADFGLAGLVAGCSALARVDSYTALIAVALAAVAVVALPPAGERRAGGLRALSLVGGAAVPVLVGWLDLTQLSRDYYGRLHHQITLQLLALAAVILVGPVLARLAWRPAIRSWLASTHVRSRLAVVAGAVVLASFGFLASRPLWSHTHAAARNVNLENMQRVSGAAVDGTRQYNEQTVAWQAMYLGWPSVLLAVAGYVVLITALVRRRSYALVGTLAMGLLVSGLYLWTSQITPDQPWAMRRYVPVVTPLLLVAAAGALSELWRWQRARPWARALAVAGGVLMLAVPALITRPMAGVRDESGQLAQLLAICHAVGDSGAVVEVDAPAQAGYGQAIRSYCDVPAIALPGAQPAQLSSVRAAVTAHGRTLFLLSQDAAATRYASAGVVAAFSSVTVQRWPNVINRAPSAASHQRTTVFLSTVDADGFAHAVGP